MTNDYDQIIQQDPMIYEQIDEIKDELERVFEELKRLAEAYKELLRKQDNLSEGQGKIRTTLNENHRKILKITEDQLDRLNKLDVSLEQLIQYQSGMNKTMHHL